MLEHWLWYAERKMTAHQKCALLEHFRDPETVYLAGEQTLSQAPDMTPELLETLMDKDLTDAKRLKGQCRTMHISVLTYTDDQYPARLRSLHDAPVVLYYQGVLPQWNDMPVIGVVGTRKATPYGLELAASMGDQIARCGGMVISGGALGIDTAAMEAAFGAGGVVVAVLAGGLDRLYPASNISFFHKICRTGCLLTEYPPGIPSASWHFPVRNRIISGISNGLLVVEAPAKSGALISARFAMEQGRDVFSVPGNVTSPTCAGTNALLQEGARAAVTGWDVMKEYEALYPHRVFPPERLKTWQKVAQEPMLPARNDKKSIDKLEKSTYSVVRTAISALTNEEQTLVACVDAGGGLMDEIIARSGLNAAEAKKILTRLALKKVLVLHPGGRVTLTPINE